MPDSSIPGMLLTCRRIWPDRISWDELISELDTKVMLPEPCSNPPRTARKAAGVRSIHNHLCLPIPDMPPPCCPPDDIPPEPPIVPAAGDPIEPDPGCIVPDCEPDIIPPDWPSIDFPCFIAIPAGSMPFPVYRSGLAGSSFSRTIVL